MSVRGRVLCWIAARLGRRRAVVILFGLIHVGQGLILLHDPGRFLPDDAVFYATFFPLPLRVGLWVGTGALTITFAAFRRTERWAWGVIAVMPAERLIGHAWSLVAWLTPGIPGGSEWAAAYVLFWGGLLGVLLILSGWRDDVPERLEDAHGRR